MNRGTQLNLWYVVGALFALMLFQSWYTARNVEVVPYSQFKSLLEAGQIQEVYVRDQYLEGRLHEPIDGNDRFMTNRVEHELAEEFEQYEVTFTGVIEDTWLGDILSWVIPILVFFALWMFLFRRFAEKQGMGGLMSVGKSKAKIYVERNTGTTFDDMAGADEAKAELEEVVEFLKDTRRYGRLGARIPKGILLVGPPGTGKTLLAKAVAGEAGVTFFTISGSEFVEMFVGVGAARVRDLFQKAREAAPAIIFIDELDAMGRARGMGQGGGHDEKEQTLNQLLTELDGFETTEGIVLLAATNRPEILDPALLRAGRFDRQVLVDRPEKRGRAAILRVHLKRIPHLADDVSPEAVAELTPGFTGADLANLVNEAALLATRRQREAVTMDDFNEAVERLIAGLEKRNRVLSGHERTVVAHHEMGHALVALALPNTDPVHKISIIPRGVGALGYTLQRPAEERFLMSRADLKNKMAVLLGGRAAEILMFNEITTGAGDDLNRATDIARDMVTRFGMVESLGQMAYEERRQSFLGQPGPMEKHYSEETAREIDCAVRELVDEALATALHILSTFRQELEDTARVLLEREALLADDLPRLDLSRLGNVPSLHKEAADA